MKIKKKSPEPYSINVERIQLSGKKRNRKITSTSLFRFLCCSARFHVKFNILYANFFLNVFSLFVK